MLSYLCFLVMLAITCKLYKKVRNTRLTYTPIIRRASSTAEDAEGLAMRDVDLSADNN